MTVTPFHSPVLVKRRFTPPKPASAFRMASSASAQFVRHRDRRRGVERVVPSRHRQMQVGDLMRDIGLAVAEGDLEVRAAAHRGEIDQPHVGLRIFAIGDDAAILDLADHALHHRMIDAHHGEAVERHVLDEIAERVLHRVEGLEMIEMLGIDIGDDGDIGRQFQERAVALVGFHHHPVAGARAARWCRRH